jgi:hypothetical protein
MLQSDYGRIYCRMQSLDEPRDRVSTQRRTDWLASWLVNCLSRVPSVEVYVCPVFKEVLSYKMDRPVHLSDSTTERQRVSNKCKNKQTQVISTERNSTSKGLIDWLVDWLIDCNWPSVTKQTLSWPKGLRGLSRGPSASKGTSNKNLYSRAQTVICYVPPFFRLNAFQKH